MCGDGNCVNYDGDRVILSHSGIMSGCTQEREVKTSTPCVPGTYLFEIPLCTRVYSGLRITAFGARRTILQLVRLLLRFAVSALFGFSLEYVHVLMLCIAVIICFYECSCTCSPVESSCMPYLSCCPSCVFPYAISH